jgi:hypothetical protein
MFDLRIIISIALIFIGNWLGLRMIPGGTQWGRMKGVDYILYE